MAKARRGACIPVNSLIKKPEEVLQYQFVCWFRSQYPQYSKLGWHIPNEGQRHPVVGIKMQLLGLLKGVPDFVIMVPMENYHGLAIEFKTGRNKTTDAQKSILSELDSVGYRVAVCWNLEDAQMIVRDYFKQERKVA